MLIKILYFYLISFIVHLSNAARILAVFPLPIMSHQIVFQALTHELARKGHELTIITTNPAFGKDLAPHNVKEIDVHDISYSVWRSQFTSVVNRTLHHIPAHIKLYYSAMVKTLDAQMNTSEIRALINDTNARFDLILTESFIELPLAFHYKFKAPIIQISSFGGIDENYETLGASTHPFLYHEQWQKRILNLTLWEKIVKLYTKYQIKAITNDAMEKQNKLIKKYFGDDALSISELRDEVDLLFLNTHPMWEGNRPVPPSVVFLGALHIKPTKPLPKDLKNYLDSSVNGVIYISFGTNVDTSLLPLDRVQVLAKTFARLPYDVLWKWNSDVLPGKPENVRISKWLPQNDILHHPNVKLFITQGGLQSTDEAIAAGIPIIGIPMIGDQSYNAERYIQFNIGLLLELKTITENIFEQSIKKVISDKSYRENVKKLSKLMSDQPQTPLERAVWWTEYVLRHGGAKHLRSPGANISWAEYLALDFVSVLGALTLVSLIISSVIFQFFAKHIMFILIKEDDKLKCN